MFKTILCPTDLGERSFAALEKAVALARQFGSKIVLLNIHEEFMDDKERRMLRVSVSDVKGKFKKTAEECKEKMRGHVEKLQAQDLDVDYVLREGKPEITISEYAYQSGCDLIVIATDGRDNLKDFVSGTISEHVINTAKCPTLVIPHK